MFALIQMYKKIKKRKFQTAWYHVFLSAIVFAQSYRWKPPGGKSQHFKGKRSVVIKIIMLKRDWLRGKTRFRCIVIDAFCDHVTQIHCVLRRLADLKYNTWQIYDKFASVFVVGAYDIYRSSLLCICCMFLGKYGATIRLRVDKPLSCISNLCG